ncbi:MAG: methyltransferase, partial [Chloroflexi bacterium]|nr:methyltransferase [Chloroflexota bacterium]
DGTPAKLPYWVRPEPAKDGWALRSGSGRVIGRMPQGCYFFEQAYYPFQEAADLDGIPQAMQEALWTGVARPPGPLASGADGWQRLTEGARALRASSNRAIIAIFGGALMELGSFLYRHDNFLMLLAGNPKEAHAFLDRVLEMHLARLEAFLGAVGPHVDIITFSDDLGIQTGPMISPKMYRTFFKPRHKVLWSRAKELAPVKTLLHSCGSVRAFIPDFIDNGLDALNPVQVSAAGMDVAELKREFGRDITFWGGGCDAHHVLPRGTPEEVRQHVRGQVAALRPGGGFVFQQVHNVVADVPAANIAAMLQAVNA